MKVLVAEDDVDALDVTAYVLRREGYTVVTAVDGRQAVKRWEAEKPDLVLLDVMLPNINGYEVCRKIRSESNVPVILVTARDRDEDVVRGLDLGADDYVVKPFSNKQLLARMRTVMRRSGMRQPIAEANQLAVGTVIIDVETHEVMSKGQLVRLTPLEFRLLHCLVSNRGRLVSTNRLIQFVWGTKDGGDANLLKTHISHLRRKLGVESGKPGYIRNVPGTGYAIVC